MYLIRVNSGQTNTDGLDFREYYQETITESVANVNADEKTQKGKKGKGKVKVDTYQDNILQPFTKFLKLCYSESTKTKAIGTFGLSFCQPMKNRLH